MPAESIDQQPRRQLRFRAASIIGWAREFLLDQIEKVGSTQPE